MTRQKLFVALGIVIALALLHPAPLHAWTPGTHIYLGEAVLGNLSRLPAAVAELIHAFPFDYLYGNIAADSSIAKKYAPVGRHCLLIRSFVRASSSQSATARAFFLRRSNRTMAPRSRS